MMKKIKRILCIFVILMIINVVLNINGTITYAKPDGESTPAESTGGSWLNKEDITHEFKDTTSVTDTTTNVLTTMSVIIKLIGVAVAIIMLLTLGMKYMMSAPGEKGEIKKHAVVYVIGAVVLFGAVGLLTIIEQFASSINTAIK